MKKLELKKSIFPQSSELGYLCRGDIKPERFESDDISITFIKDTSISYPQNFLHFKKQVLLSNHAYNLP